MIKENGVYSTRQTIENVKWAAQKRYASASFEKLAAQNFLRNNLLAAQSKEVFNDLFPYLESVYLAGGENIYKPGDQIDFIYFPETAVVSEFQILEDGRTIEIAMTGSEGIVGILPIFDLRRAVNWTQIALGGTVARINSRVFENRINSHHSFQKLLFEYINLYVGQISQRSVCNCYHSIEQRFCSWLLMLQERKKSHKLSLTQEQIARALGVHRPSLTHIAQNLRAKKTIDYMRGIIYILNRPALEGSACSCFSEIDGHSAFFD